MLVYIGDDIVNTDCVVMVKKLEPPFYSRFDSSKLITHVVELKKEYHTDFVRNIFVSAAELEDLHRMMAKERGEEEEEEELEILTPPPAADPAPRTTKRTGRYKRSYRRKV